MGIFDPMTIGTAAMTGVLPFTIGPALWAILLGTLSASGAAIALSGRRLRRTASLAPLRLVHARTSGMNGAH